jgi:hypothetical protein
MNGPLTPHRVCPVHRRIAMFAYNGECVKPCPRCELEALRAMRKL